MNIVNIDYEHKWSKDRHLRHTVAYTGFGRDKTFCLYMLSSIWKIVIEPTPIVCSESPVKKKKKMMMILIIFRLLIFISHCRIIDVKLFGNDLITDSYSHFPQNTAGVFPQWHCVNTPGGSRSEQYTVYTYAYVCLCKQVLNCYLPYLLNWKH